MKTVQKWTIFLEKLSKIGNFSIENQSITKSAVRDHLPLEQGLRLTIEVCKVVI